MAIIDADAHVVENENTWTYVGSSERELMPVLVTLPGRTGREATFWAIDGRLVGTGPVSETDAVKADRELDDVPARVQHMDELGTDVQVLFPTFFLRPITERTEVELALCRSYNRWLAERCEQAPGRLRWAVIPPTRTMEAAVEELRFGKEHGACAVFWRGIEGERLPADPYFYPLYEEASRLDLPICIHAATGNFYQHDVFDGDLGFWRFKLPGLTAFHNLLTNKLPERFPGLRFGFVELSSQWVPYALHDFVRRMEKRGQHLDPAALMAENRIFVACQTDDDVAYVLKYAGAGNLVAGTDYGHADTSSELEALKRLRYREDVATADMDRILDNNPRALYGL
ncbi:MAG TPA: amidohydrolase family protein [Chloroflexota bacterium]|nr:amidohydrolase family protein [Chloroflexota bacterium]